MITCFRYHDIVAKTSCRMTTTITFPPPPHPKTQNGAGSPAALRKYHSRSRTSLRESKGLNWCSKTWNGGHVGIPKQSCAYVSWTFFLMLATWVKMLFSKSSCPKARAAWRNNIQLCWLRQLKEQVSKTLYWFLLVLIRCRDLGRMSQFGWYYQPILLCVAKLVQWNHDLTKGKGTDQICSL